MKLLLALAMMASSLAAMAAPKPPMLEKVGVASRAFTPKEPRNWRGSAKHALDCIVWYPAAESANEVEQTIGPPDAPLFLEGKAAPDAPFVVDGGKRPLVVLSHGAGGSAAQMAWLGMALARAGMVAVAVNHPGNNATEALTPEGFLLWWERATDLSNVIDGMLADKEFGPRIDARLIGAAGFSMGGYAMIELAGGRTDIEPLYLHCTQHPEAPGCTVPEMKGLPPGKSMIAAVRKSSGESLARSNASYADDRVRGVFAIAPAMGAAFPGDALKSVHIPVALVVGNADPIAPAGENAEMFRAGIHGAKLAVLPGGVAHYTFLDECGDAGKKALPTYCVDNPGVDRAAVHAQVGEMAVKFFDQTLKWK